MGQTQRGNGTKRMVMADAHGLPRAVPTAAASPHEVTLVEAPLATTDTVGQPRRLMGERAYDRAPLDQRRAAPGLELMAPHRCNRTRTPTQDGRARRRDRRRWKSDRLFAWLHKSKRVMTRWDRGSERVTACVHLALAMIVWRRLQRCL